MPSLTLDREKYLHILDQEGLSAAITALHHDTWNWEFEAFEGAEGYQPQMIQELESVRQFSRELWDLAMKQVPGAR